MRISVGALVVLVGLGCGATEVQTNTIASADQEPLGASAVAALGVTEVTTGVPDAERATRSVTALVGLCVRTHLQREPFSRGTLGFHFRAEEPGKLSTTGEFSSEPVAGCIGSALAKAVIPSGVVGTIDYVLTFHGNYADKYPVDGRLDVRHVLLDWSSPDSVAPTAAANDLQKVQRRLEFCALGAEPQLSGAYFAAIRVGSGFSTVEVAPAQEGPEARACMTRALREVDFTHLGTDYAIGLVATPARGGALTGELNAAPTDDPIAAPRNRNLFADQVAAPRSRPRPVKPRPLPPPLLLPTPVSGAQVKLGPAPNLSPLAAAAVQRAVVARREAIRGCYRRGLEEDRRLAGTLVAEFEVAANGTLNNFKIGSELGTQTAVCVGNFLSMMTISSPEAPFAVRYPMEFFVGSAPPDEVVPDVQQTLQKKLVADSSLADLERQLSQRDLEFIRIPANNLELGVFFRAGENVLGAFFATAGAAGNADVCQSSTSGRVLVVRGRGCASVLKRVLD